MIHRRNLFKCPTHNQYEPIDSKCFENLGFVVVDDSVPSEPEVLDVLQIKTPEKFQWHEGLWDLMVRQAAIVRRFRD